MPDIKNLKVGDKIRVLKVPEGDLKQRRREIAEGIDNPGWTANTIELIIAQNPIVKIESIDEYGRPWYTCDIIVDGELETHTLAMNEDDVWELA